MFDTLVTLLSGFRTYETAGFAELSELGSARHGLLLFTRTVLVGEPIYVFDPSGGASR
jgi:hypothetical protein